MSQQSVSLLTRTFKAVRAYGTAALAVNVINALELLIVARLLAPSDLGVMRALLVVLALPIILQDFGVGNALIHRRKVPDSTMSSLYWATVALGAILSLLLLALSPVIETFFRDPRLGSTMPVIAAYPLIASFGQLFSSLLEKELLFARLASIESFTAAAGAVLTLGLAWQGAGVWALIYGYLGETLAKSVVLVVNGSRSWRPKFVLRLNEVRPLFSFGSLHTGQRVVNYASSNADFILIGRFLGTTALGYYSLAYTLANLASSKVNSVFSRIFFPIASRLQDEPERLKRGYLLFQGVSAAINFPMLAGLATIAPSLPLVMGSKWSESILLLQILCVVGLTRAIAGTVGPLILARGRVLLGFGWSILVFMLQVPAIFIGLQLGGLPGVALSFALVQILLLVLNYLLQVRPLVGPCLSSYAWSMVPSALSSLGMVMVLLSMRATLLGPPDSTVDVVIEVALGALVYVLLSASLNRRLVGMVRQGLHGSELP